MLSLLNQEFLQYFNILICMLTGAACLCILLTKISIFIKIPAIASVCYAAMMLAAPERMMNILGDKAQVVAIVSFVIASGALTLSFYRFMRAGVIITFWLLIAGIAGTTAFPNFFSDNISHDFYSGAEAHSAMSADLIEFLSKQLKSYH